MGHCVRQFFLVCVFVCGPAAVALGDADDEAVAKAIAALAAGPHASARRAAIEELSGLSQSALLPERAITTLLTTAKSDAYISNRLEATRLLASLPITEATKAALGQSWAEELTNPRGPEWNNVLVPISAADVHREITNLLATFYDPPYPDHVIEAWIAELRIFAASDAVALLQKVRSSQGLSEEQIGNIKLMGARANTVEMRHSIFGLVAEPLDDGLLARTVDEFEHARNTSDRLYAGYALKFHFSDRRVPAGVVAAAGRVIQRDKYPEVRGVAAALIARGETAFDERENVLLAALGNDSSNHEMSNAILGLYGDDRLQELVTRYVADPAAPRAIKIYALQELRKRDRPEESLAPATRAALIEAAWATSDYYLIASIRGTLEDWNNETPWIVYLKSSDVQSRALFVLFAICGLLVSIGGLAALVFVLRRPYQGPRAGTKRTSAVLGWIGLSIAMLGLLAFAFLGFLGHNYAPKPTHTLVFNIPLYVGTLIYLSLAGVIIARAKRAEAAATCRDRVDRGTDRASDPAQQRLS